MVALRKISSKFLATILLAMLLIITALYYIFPGHDSLFMTLSCVFGAGPILIIAIIVIMCITISIIKIVTQRFGREVKRDSK